MSASSEDVNLIVKLLVVSTMDIILDMINGGGAGSLTSLPHICNYVLYKHELRGGALMFAVKFYMK